MTIERVETLPQRIETLIVGGGQAGLATSHMLSRRGRPHLVLERGRIAERWRTERWDGLRFQFPNWSVRLPDFPLRTSDPEAFCTSPEIVDFLEAYAMHIAAPIRCGVTVTALHRGAAGSDYLAETSHGPIAAANVVVATGPYQRPIVPDLLNGQSHLFQVHASRYRAAAQLPGGPVLVIGAGASGAQIAEELVRAGRTVHLSVGHHRRLPRRYRGHDLTWWLTAMGLDQTPVRLRGPDRTLPLITGAYGGHTVDFRGFARQGVILHGRVTAAHGRVLQLSGDLARSIADGDAAYLGFLERADAHVARHGLDLPAEPEARRLERLPSAVSDPPRTLDLDAAGIGAVIWATGYGCDFSWIHLPVIDPRGEPVHTDGVTDVPGLYFIGLQWLSKMNSSFLAGVGDDAARLADHIVARHGRR